MEKKKPSSISKAKTYEKMGEFWDSRDFTEFDEKDAPDAEFEISCKNIRANGSGKEKAK